MVLTLFQVALGGAIGAVLRYLTIMGAMRLLGPGFPMGTIIVNVVGSFLMGALIVLLSRKGGTALAPLVLTGVLGGFTTFSAFSLDAMTLWERGAHGLALGYVTASVLFSLAAIAAGLFVARNLL